MSRPKTSRRQQLRRSLLFVSFLLFPATLYYFSPVVSVTGAAGGVITGSVLFFGLLFLGSLVLGRAYCGWICPGGGSAVASSSVVTRPHRGGWRNAIKWGVWALWLGAMAVAAWSAGGLQEVSPFHKATFGISMASLYGFIAYAIILTIFGLSAVLSGRRGFCHSVCWMAPFMILGRRLRDLVGAPGLRLQPAPASCNGCGRCERECPMSLSVKQMVAGADMTNDECILCGRCVDGCKRQAIAFAYGRKRG